ncbi:S8 family serine peptidase [uncultured Jatrophihabitans sp.]|uniref:S53 family peptidase n=1 Tax=uncultured Jatrophihabitans sp. TaxID=1610747 RepID=UPI0035CAF93E
MRRSSFIRVLLVSVLVLVLDSAGAAGATPAQRSRLALDTVCNVAPAGYATCDAQVVVGAVATPASTTAGKPRGLTPADIRSAYALSATAGRGRTVAVISAYDNPAAAANLAVYRRTFGLPACTIANGCLRKVSQSGGSRMPVANAAWASETDLDLDMVSAACASCRILLVQATTSSMVNLATAVNYAATQQVSAISNSYSSSDTSQSAAYDHPGIAITASTGDNGHSANAPATYRTVIAVGGTSLKRANNARGWTETAWAGSGSGCSTKNAKPQWQTTASSCPGKAVADVAAVADPRTGVATYQGKSGWQVFGGTSAATPIIAGVYALSGNTKGYPGSYTWAHQGGLNDITSGSTGTCSGYPSRWCTARPGWDGPTGLGSPRGTSSF